MFLKPIHAFIAIAALALSPLAGAQPAYPSRPVTVVIPAPPGGAVDTLARVYAEEMSKALGKPVVVDNRPGAGGTLAVQAVARAAPDGHTILFSHAAPVLHVPYVMPKVPYDVRRDLAFITQVTTGPIVMAVNASTVPARTYQEFLDWAGRNKGRISYGSYGIGTSGHLYSAYLDKSRNLDMAHIAYKGEAPMAQDLAAGQIPWAMGSVGVLAPFVKTGHVRPLMVFHDRRVPDLPDVPTMAELGLKDPEFRPQGWIVVMATAKTPSLVLERIEAESRKAVQSTAMKARMQIYAMQPIGSSSAEFRKVYDEGAAIVQRLVELSGARQE